MVNKNIEYVHLITHYDLEERLKAYKNGYTVQFLKTDPLPMLDDCFELINEDKETITVREKFPKSIIDEIFK